MFLSDVLSCQDAVPARIVLLVTLCLVLINMINTTFTRMPVCNTVNISISILMLKISLTRWRLLKCGFSPAWSLFCSPWFSTPSSSGRLSSISGGQDIDNRLVHSGYSGLVLIMMLLRQLSYAIKTQLKALIALYYGVFLAFYWFFIASGCSERIYYSTVCLRLRQVKVDLSEHTPSVEGF